MQYLLIRHEKLICSFAFEVSGLRPKAVVISRLFPFCIDEHDISHLKMRSQKRAIRLQFQKTWSKVSVSLPQKVQRSLSLTVILCKNEFFGSRRCKLKLENYKSSTFCALSCQLKNFFQLISSPFSKAQSSCHFENVSVFHS